MHSVKVVRLNLSQTCKRWNSSKPFSYVNFVPVHLQAHSPPAAVVVFTLEGDEAWPGYRVSGESMRCPDLFS
jgi:hypothetical protein